MTYYSECTICTTFAPIRLIMTIEFVAKIVNILEIEEDFEIFS